MSVSRVILGRIKQQLSAKGIPYKRVAQDLRVAESTVKRWFSSGNLSLSQLDQLCGLLHLDLTEIARAEQTSEIRETFTPAQEDFFIKNERAFVIFYMLASNLPVQKIKTKLNLTEPKINQELLLLDKNKIIELHPGGTIRMLASAGTWWDPKGVLAQKYYSLIKSDFISSDFSANREEQWYFSGPLTESSQEIISKKMNELAYEIRELYRLDRREKAAKNIILFVGMRPWIFPLLKKYFA